MEQPALFQQFNLKTKFDDYKNVAAGAPTPEISQPAALMCPSDSAVGRFFLHRNGGTRSYGKGNYAGFTGPEHATCIQFSGAIQNNGMELRRVSDGTSNTLMIGEVRTRDEASDERGVWTLAWVGATLLAVDLHSEATGTGSSCTGAALDPSVIYSPVSGQVAADQAQAPNLPPGRFNADWIRSCPEGEIKVAAELDGMPCEAQSSNDYYSAAPRSLHPGGVIAANVDGSVTFLRDEIQPQAFALMACIDDGRTPEP
jgi:hypothetical protein